MKNRRRIIIALVLVAVFAVGAVLYFTVLGPALEPEETVKIPIETQQGEAIDTTDRIQIFPRITAENVQSISVKNEHGSFEIYRDPNNDFRIKGYEHLSLNTTKVSELVSDRRDTPLERKKIDSAARVEQYGSRPRRGMDDNGQGGRDSHAQRRTPPAHRRRILHLP